MGKKKPSKTTLTISQEKMRVSQQDVPSSSLEKTIRVARAFEQYGYKPITPLQLARALDMQPTSGPFRTVCGTAIAYGLTKGGYNAEQISLEPLGKRIVRPTEEGDDEVAKREAILRPRVIREFLEKYNGAPVPREDIALNVLHDFGVPRDRAKDVFDLIFEGANGVGFIHDIKGRKYVELSEASANSTSNDEPVKSPVGQGNVDGVQSVGNEPPAALPDPPKRLDARSRRVFVTHGKNVAFVDPIKKLLAFGELESVVSVERPSVSQPVPDKVMNDMRTCGAAIIHVEDELRLMDQNASEHVILNPNVLIEIGAAMALYGRRFILLVREGVKLPSNLHSNYSPSR
jgi:hypothetical protein